MTDPTPAEPMEGDGPSTDRGISPIAGRLGGRRGRLITTAALAVGCGVFLAATWDRGERPDDGGSEPQAPPRELAPFEPARRDAAPRLAEASTDPDAPRLSPTREIPDLEPTDPAGAAGASTEDQRRALAESARRAPVMAFSQGAAPSPQTAAAAPNSAPIPQPGPLARLTAVAPIETEGAIRLGDRHLLLTAGAALPCVLQTAMDSTTPGLVACVLPRDVYSDSGTVVLLERGTRVLGQYQGGLQQGRRRLFVLWTRAVTPSGVAVALASPAADALGRSGFDGTVDTRFWDRFGGALMLSIVDDAAYAALGDGDALRGTARLPSDAAATALQGAIDIPPTLRKAQGSEVSILIARDLDFRSVYALRPRP